MALSTFWQMYRYLDAERLKKVGKCVPEAETSIAISRQDSQC